MLESIFAGITSFVISYSFLPFIIRFSQKKKIGDLPGRRRIHKELTPSLGGAAIFSGFTLACICWANHGQFPSPFLLLPILIIPFIVGLLDDLISLRPVAKLIAQIITASLIFFTLKIRLTSFYGFIGHDDFTLLTSYLATLVTVVAITNSLNLIDGIDGLASVLSFISTLFFGSWFLFAGSYPLAMVCFALAGGILAFLFQNWEPSKIFMGDTGSLVIGTLLSIFTIQFMNENHALPIGHAFKFTSSIGAAISVIIIPLIDTSRVTLIRISKNISPFIADKRHIHHALVRLDFSQKQVVYILALTQMCFIGMAILLRKANEWYLLTVIIVIATILCILLERSLKNLLLRAEKPAKHPRAARASTD